MYHNTWFLDKEQGLCYKGVMWDYTEMVKELFLHPRNVGEVKDADAIGEVGSIICGDALRLTLKIERETDRILDARFQTFGCASAIASSSALTEMVRGKTLEEALSISNRDIAEYLGGLPHEKMHCSVMGREALEAAIDNYRGVKKGKEAEGKTVCKCFDVTEEKITRVARDNSLRTVEAVTNFTKAGGGCGDCIPEVERILRRLYSGMSPEESIMPAKKLTNLQKIEMIKEIITDEVRPRLLADGGDVQLIDVDGNTVIISLRGMCTDCRMSGVTAGFIEKKLREHISNELRVETV